MSFPDRMTRDECASRLLDLIEDPPEVAFDAMTDEVLLRIALRYDVCQEELSDRVDEAVQFYSSPTNVVGWLERCRKEFAS